jgi:AmmeMemoRadiSam system protein A
MSRTPPELTKEQGQVLVQLARNTIGEKLLGKSSGDQSAGLRTGSDDAALLASCGSFVTLKIDDRLRGCIGSLTAKEPLRDNVRTNALNAAFHDPRFPSLTSAELERVHIEVSVLTEPQPLKYTGSTDLVSKLRPRIDGVTLRKGMAGATFLPQVWEQLPKTEEFLSHLCLKAGLDADAWRNADLNVEVYQVQSFAEERK